MDLQSLRILMEINALQSFGSVQSSMMQTNTNNNLFSTMLGDVLSQTNHATEHSLNSNPLLYKGDNEVFLPTSLNQLLASQVKSLTNTNNTQIQTSAKPQHENDFTHIIKTAAERFQLPERLISSVIKHESNFNSQTVSRAGAQGLMQLMPGTAKFLGVKNSFDPEQNINGGARYLRQMLDQFNGDTKLALAAYNAGPGNVKKYGGIPPFKETQNYVQKVLNSFNG